MDEDGYPLREEADDPFPPPPPAAASEPDDPVEEIYAAPVEPARPSRRFVRPHAWPVLGAALLLLVGLGAAYALSRPRGSSHPAAPPAAAASAPAPPPPAAASPPTTAPADNPPPPPAAPASPSTVAVPSVVGTSLPRATASLKGAGSPRP